MILDKQVQIVRTGCIHTKIKRSTRSYTCFSHVICFHSVPSWALFLLKWMYAFSQMKYLFDGNNVKFLWKQKLVHLTAAESLQSCLTVQRRRSQPTRLPCPWDSPGKNTGVGCHCLLQCIKVESESEVTQSCPTLRDPMGCSLPGSSIHGVFQARTLEWVAIAFSSPSN